MARVVKCRRCRPMGVSGAPRRCFRLGARANENPPKLHAFDPKGFRRDVVEFYPGYHELMRASVAAGLHASTWTSSGQRAAPPAEVVRSARYYMAAQVESGHLCPITMTRAALAPLAAEPELLRRSRAESRHRKLRRDLQAVVGKAGHNARYGHDRKTGRHRRAGQFHDRDADAAIPIRSPATNGFSRPRCAMLFWCWRRRRAA